MTGPAYSDRVAAVHDEKSTTGSAALRRRVVLALVGVLALAAATTWGAEAVRPPERFDPREPGGVGMSGPMPVDSTMLVGIAYSDHPVDLDEATVVVDESSAQAAIALVACSRRDGAPGLGGAADRPLSGYCRSVDRPTDVPVGGPTDGTEMYLVAVVRPLEPGRIYLDGVEVTHSRGPFSRTERAGVGVELFAE